VAVVYAGKVEVVLLCSREEKRLQSYRHPVLIFREFDRFMTVLKETGVRDTVLKTHFMTAAVIPPIFYFLWPAVIIPVALGVISHLFSDLAHINRSSEG
jgi:hypothetical protein